MLKTNFNVDCDLVNATLYNMVVCMLAVLQQIPMISKSLEILPNLSNPIPEIPVKALVFLSCLVAYPQHYPPFTNNLFIHRAVKHLFDGNKEGLLFFSSNWYSS